MTPCIKGVAFRTAELCFAELYGTDLRDSARALLQRELGDAYRYQLLMAATWYPIEWYRETFAAYRQVIGAGVELPREIGRLSARKDMASVYKQVFAKLVSPQALISMSERMFNVYYDTGKLETVESRKGYVRAKCSNCIGWDENIWNELAGSCEALLEIASAKHVRLRLVSGGRNGDVDCEIEAHWI